MTIIISADLEDPAISTERDDSLGSRSSSGDQSVRSARAMKVFGDLVSDESSLCYSPSPHRAKKGLRNITNVCNSSPANILPFNSAKKNAKKLSGYSVAVETSGKEPKQQKISETTQQKPIQQKEKKTHKVPVKANNLSPKQNKSERVKKRPMKRAPKSPAKKHFTQSKFRANESSIKRKAQASKAQFAIREATESVNQTLNATRLAKIDHHRNVAAEVNRLREEWIAEKEEAARFYAEVDKTKKEMLNIRKELSSQYAHNKAESERVRFQERLHKLDKEIKFKSDVFVEHKKKLKENEDQRRRLSTHLKANIWKERRDATAKIQMQRIEEDHERFEHKWAGEEDAKEYLKQCAKERRESFAFRNAEGTVQRVKAAEEKVTAKQKEHAGFELKWAGEEDANEYLKQCDQARRESFAFRNAQAKRIRNDEEERKNIAKINEHHSYEKKWAGEKDAEEYLRKCQIERRDSFAFRNAENRSQRLKEAEQRADQKVSEHKSYELKWAGEKDADEYLKQCEKQRRDSFAFRNAEGRHQRLEEEESNNVAKFEEHKSYELKWAGEKDAEEYKKRCEKARRQSFAARGKECMRHKAVMDELKNIAKEKEHESYVLKWAAQDDVKEYLVKVAKERRDSLAFRNYEGKRHRELEEKWKCEEVEEEHERELIRAGCQKDVEEYKQKCADRDRASLIYRGKEVQIRRLVTEQQREIEYEEDQERRALDTLARADVDEYVKDCKQRRRLSLAQRATESRRHMSWKKTQQASEREQRRRHVQNMGLDRRYVELAKQKERAKSALDALRRAKGSFSTSNPFGSLID